jgi:hypothetical protein
MAGIPSNNPELLEALRELTGADPSSIKRVVIDIQSGSLPMVYVDLFGNKSLVDVIRTLDGIEVSVSLETQEE